MGSRSFWPAHITVALSFVGRLPDRFNGCILLGYRISNHTFTPVSIDGVPAEPPASPCRARTLYRTFGEALVIPFLSRHMGMPIATPVGTYSVISKTRASVTSGVA